MDDVPYTQAHMLLARFLQRDRGEISELGRSIVLDHGRRTERATLLFHGMSASPAQFAAIAKALYERGHNVFVPRLPQHGRRDRLTTALALLTAQQLRDCAEGALAIARGLGEHVTVAGFSLGGLLAAHIAQFHRVDRVVAIAPFLGVSFLPGLFTRALGRWLLRIPNRFYWWDPLLRDRQMPEHGYPRYATHAIAHGLTVAQDVMEAARMHAPEAESVVLLLNARELTVNNRAAQRLARAWKIHKPGAVEMRTLKNLTFGHDFIEPERYFAAAQRALPVIVDLIDS